MFEQLTKDTKILVIDDNETMVRINKKVMQTIGYRNTDQALSGQKALQMVKKEADLGQPYELVLLDWNMPEVSGVEVLRFIRKYPKSREAFVIMVTAESNRENVILAVQEGLDDYIIKPFAPNTVIRKLKSLAKKGMNDVYKLSHEIIETRDNKLDIPKSEITAKIEQAKQRFLHSIKLDLQNQKEILIFSKFLIQINNFNDAAKLLHYVFSINRVNPDAHYLVAKICFMRGNYHEAENRLSKVLTIKQDHIPALELSGELALRNGDYNLAMEYFKKVIKVSEERGNRLNEVIHTRIGRALAAQNEDEQAQSHFNQSITLNPDYISAYYNLMMVYNRKKELGSALSVFERAKQISPKNSQEWVELGKMYIDFGDPEKASFAFQNAEKKEPANAHIRNQIGETYQNHNMPEKAITYFKKNIEVDSQSPDSLNTMGIALRRLGNSQEAITYYERALALDNSNKKIHYNISAALVEAGKSDSAKAHLKQALELDPNFKEAKAMYEKLTAYDIE